MICLSPAAPLTLSRYLEECYCLAKYQSPGTLQQKRVSIKLLERFAGSQLLLAHVTQPLLNAWIKSLEASSAKSTAHAKRKDIMALLRQAFHDDLLPEPMRGVRTVRISRENPKAWKPIEVAGIIAAAGRHPRADVLVATLRLLWDTDCRISAIYEAPLESLDRERHCVLLTEPKTGALSAYAISGACLAALDRLPAKRARLCGATVNIRRLRTWLTEVLKSAGLEHDRRSKFHRIRRSKYTAVAIAHGLPAAAKHARHTSTAMARFYLDESLVPDAHLIALPSVGELLFK